MTEAFLLFFSSGVLILLGVEASAWRKRRKQVDKLINLLDWIYKSGGARITVEPSEEL